MSPAKPVVSGLGIIEGPPGEICKLGVFMTEEIKRVHADAGEALVCFSATMRLINKHVDILQRKCVELPPASNGAEAVFILSLILARVVLPADQMWLPENILGGNDVKLPRDSSTASQTLHRRDISQWLDVPQTLLDKLRRDDAGCHSNHTQDKVSVRAGLTRKKSQGKEWQKRL